MPQINFEEIKKQEPVPAGSYLVEIVHAEETVSRKGNEMFKIRHQIIMDSEGDTEHEGRVVFDNLVFAFDSESDFSLQRVKQCMTACGWSPEYNGGVEAEEFVGKVLNILVTIRQSDDINPETGEQYDPQNNVRKYVKASPEQLAAAV